MTKLSSLFLFLCLGMLWQLITLIWTPPRRQIFQVVFRFFAFRDTLRAYFLDLDRAAAIFCVPVSIFCVLGSYFFDLDRPAAIFYVFAFVFCFWIHFCWFWLVFAGFLVGPWWYVRFGRFRRSDGFCQGTPSASKFLICLPISGQFPADQQFK